MIDSVDIPNLPGYISIKEAAEMLGVSDKRVYQYEVLGRLPSQRVGHILILPTEKVKRFKPRLPLGESIAAEESCLQRTFMGRYVWISRKSS